VESRSCDHEDRFKIGAKPTMRTRAILLSVVVGFLLVIINVYLALTVGFTETGNLLTATLAFALGHLFRRPLRAEESYLAQAFASCAGACTTITGVSTLLPILVTGGANVSGWLIVPWAAALGILGVLLGAALRHALLERDELVFPTGIATAATITALHSGTQASGARTLGLGAVAAAAIAVLRDAIGWIPGPIRPLLLGIGALVGLPATAGMLGSGLATWLWAESGLTPEAKLAAWIVWPAVALMLSETVWLLVSGLAHVRGSMVEIRGSLSRSRLPRAELGVAALAAATVIVTGKLAFDLHPLIALAVLALAVLPATAAARSAGRTDVIPAEQGGQVSMSIVGLASRAPVAAMATGVEVMGTSAYTSLTLMNLKVGLLLRAPWRRAVAVQALGAIFGAACGFAAFVLYTRQLAIGSPALPAPSMHVWRTISAAVAGGGAAIPAGAGTAATIALAAGLVLCALRRQFRFLPPPVVLGIGAILPLVVTAGLFAGGLAAWIAGRWWKGWSERHVAKLAAGSIMGESLIVVAEGLVARP